MRLSILVVGLPLLAGGCASTLPADVVVSNDVQQEHSSGSYRYHSPISGYTSRQPVDPKPWRQQNGAQSSSVGDAS